MLDLRAAAHAHERPYRWAEVHDFIDADGMRRLREQFPPARLLPRSRRDSGGDKTYRMSVLPLVRRGEPLAALAGLGPAWHELTAALTASAYRSWVRSLVAVDVTDSVLDIGLFAFGPGDRISPHTDKTGKHATHVLYLNEHWESGYGGQFEVRSTPDPETPPSATVTPGEGRSVLFPRSDRSWHAVAPVAAHAPEHRLTIQVEMWR
ncbi:2OG-Fe(II) oxygenase [Streptomyces tsukubensis]|uniref:Prolyl 4-hydroxylase alpha subunit domain-containing protein n=1 Tax=Streptomyces tsukubensis TaxID=83656 RepID=A0A1V4AH31_9ACTN|nr:2OG-Fe(II) oxygenase [Streptomyces tsukubensis]OON82753.1 hypothetical protein B1H18_01560 [Streptomyces tsukubensis]QFR92071.1 hypothetical protein GBW32_02125 [Streptomyces tsukubensis]